MWRLLACALALSLSGCNWIQSALAPGGSQARAIDRLAWVLFIGAGVIFVVVMGLLAYAILAPSDRRRWLAHRRTIVIGGIAFPAVTLLALLVYGLFDARWILLGEPAVRVDVTGERWWWRVHYVDPSGGPIATTANEIRCRSDARPSSGCARTM